MPADAYRDDIIARVRAMQACVELRLPEHVYLRRDSGAQLLGCTTALTTAGYVRIANHTDDHAARGRFIHEATLLIDRDDLDDRSVPVEWRGYCDSYKRWLDRHAPSWWLAEMLVADLLLGYAGTLDRLGIITASTLALVDFKAGARCRWHGVQLAGYKRPIVGGSAALNRAIARYTLYLKPDGAIASLWPWTDTRDEHYFLAAITCCRFREIA